MENNNQAIVINKTMVPTLVGIVGLILIVVGSFLPAISFSGDLSDSLWEEFGGVVFGLTLVSAILLFLKKNDVVALPAIVLLCTCIQGYTLPSKALYSYADAGVGAGVILMTIGTAFLLLEVAAYYYFNPKAFKALLKK